MSLLLEARKKSLQPEPASPGDAGSPSAPPGTAIPQPVANPARALGQKLFNAKKHPAKSERATIHRNLLIALAATVLFLAGWAGYVWYVISSVPEVRSTTVHPNIAATAVNTPAVPPQPVIPPPSPQPRPENSAAQPGTSSNQAARPHSKRPAAKTSNRARQSASPSAAAPDKPRFDKSIDSVLNQAYAAYRSNQFAQAQQLYQEALQLDQHNIDALLGLAVTAQQLGSDNLAAQYYAQVLALDPRNAIANAGMSALTTNDSRISRLKILLDEQPDSPALHFALGDRYAEQSRWGEAQQAYFKAYQLEPDNSVIVFNLAVSLDRLGQRSPAAQYYQLALQLDPQHLAGFDHLQTSQRIEALMH